MIAPFPLRVLILEDQPTDAELIIDLLHEAGYQLDCCWVQTKEDYLANLNDKLDIILSDYSLRQFSGLQALHLLQERGWDIPFIVITGSISEEVAVECMKQGAADYLIKDRLVRLDLAIRQAIEAKRLRDHKRQTEAALHKSAALNQAILNSLSAHIAVINQNGNIVAVNDAWQRFGSETEAASMLRVGIGTNYLDVCRQTAASGDVQAVQVLAGILSVSGGNRAEFIMEICSCRSPDDERWYSLRVTPLTDGSNGVVITYTEVTDRVIASQELEKELNLLRTLINSIPDAIYIKDISGHIIDANRETAARMGAADIADLIGKTDFDFYPPEVALQYYTQEMEVIRSGQPIINHEERGIDYGFGQERWSLTNKVPLLDKDGKVTSLIGIGRDITERRLMEQNLRKSEQRFSKAFNASPIPIYIARLEDGLIIDANDSFMTLSGYHRDAVIGRTTIELNIWLTPDRRFEYLPLLREQGFVRDGETRFCTVSGEIHTTVVSAELIELDREQCILCLIHDITERKLAQQELLNAQLLKVQLAKEKDLIEIKERFISKLSHDFRAPLAVIQASSDLISLFFDRLSPEKRLKYANEIQIQVQLMVEMVDEVLVINRAQSGKLEPHLTQLNIVPFCEAIFENMQLIDAVGHEFIFTPEGEFLPVWLDEKLLRHILNNLLTNAIKYSPNGGQIKFGLTAQDKQLIFVISDQGIGISQEDQTRLFEEFYRAHNTGNIPGTGLGLAIVKQSVEAQGGSIAVSSEENIGTTFTIHLPSDLVPVTKA